MHQDTTHKSMLQKISSGIAYFDVGHQGPTLLCLHGIQGSKESYQPFLNSSLTRQARIVVPDIPGFGVSNWPEGSTFDLDRQAENIVKFLDAIVRCAVLAASAYPPKIDPGLT